MDLIDFEDPSEPMVHQGRNGLRNPMSKSACYISWILSMEPPFYAHLHKTCREMDIENLKTLGPLSRAVDIMVNGAERFKEDRVE